MNLTDFRIARAAGINPFPRRRFGARTYAAASMGRLTADWIAGATTIDHDIRAGMIPVRSRARDLAQNNDYAKAYLRAVKKNVVGSEGFALQVKAMNYETVNGKTKPVPDALANSIIENAFYRWSSPATATISGKISFRKVQEIVVETAARDGEMFVRILRGQNVNKYGFTLQLIEPDWIDEKKSEELPNGNVVRMGIEQDRWRRPVAYYVSQRNSVSEMFGNIVPSGPYMRIPASEMIHIYDPERADQSRGMSWMAQSMLGLHDLKGYIEAAIINARSGASKQGFFRDPNGSGDEYKGDSVEASTGRQIATSEPGTFQDIGQLEFQAYDPKYPDQQFDGFMKSILRGISSGLGVSFASISNDLTEVNYSSIRAGLIEERETWKAIQSWFIETFLNRVYAEWLNMALLTGAINLPSVKYEKFNNPKWTGRRWAWVDPLKDVDASKAERAAGFKSATMIANEAGRDYEDILQEIAQERELEKQYGITPDYGGKTDGNKQGQDTADQGDEDDTPRPGDGKARGKDHRPRLLV